MLMQHVSLRGFHKDYSMANSRSVVNSMASQRVLLLFGIILVNSLQLGTCLRCYSCSSLVSGTCVDPVNVTALDTVYCNERNYGCMKEKLSDSEKTVYRGCTPIAFCETPKTDVTHCSTCTEDLCNSSSLLKPSTILVALVSLATNCVQS